MPYGVFDTGNGSKPYCVHKKDEDGEPIGAPLGCHETRDGAGEQLAALYANEEKSVGGKSVIHTSWTGAMKFNKTPRKLEVLGVPFGGPKRGKDEDGEFFSERTELLIKIGDKRPVIYNHGADPENRRELYPEVIGEATYVRRDSQGHWFDVIVDDANERAARVIDAAERGLARASSGAVNYLTRIVKATGEILVWPFSELTLIDKAVGKREPANDFAVARLKTIYEQANIELPEAFAEGGEPQADAVKEDCGCSTKVSVNPHYLAEVWRYRRTHGGNNDGT